MEQESTVELRDEGVTEKEFREDRAMTMGRSIPLALPLSPSPFFLNAFNIQNFTGSKVVFKKA